MIGGRGQGEPPFPSFAWKGLSVGLAHT